MELLKVVVLVSAFVHITMVLFTEGEQYIVCIFKSIHSVAGDQSEFGIKIKFACFFSHQEVALIGSHYNKYLMCFTTTN